MATRKVKDAKDLSTNELIYFKGHAKATFMSDGKSVEDAINNISAGGGSTDLTGYATEEYVDGKLENIVDADGYLYSNGEKVDMRFTRSLLPVGTSIPAKANLNTVAYLKIGKYYCSLNADAETVTNCPSNVAFSMEVFNPLGVNVDDETTREYTYRLRVLTKYDTGQQYIQFCKTSGTAGSWTYDTWYISPRTSFSLNSSKNGGTATKGATNRGVYIDSTGTFQQMSYTVAKSVPSNAVFTDTNTKVTAVGNHYTPTEDTGQALNAPEGEVVTGIKRDAAGHVVGVTSSPISGESGGNAEPMVCAYRITSYTANHIELENYTYNGQTMYYREGAIVSITNPLGEDVVFEGGTLTLDGNEYEADAFTIKVGATALFSLGVDSGILFPISSVVESNSGGSSEGGGSTTKEVVMVSNGTIDLLEPNKIYLLNLLSNSLQISEIAYPEGAYAEYCIMSNGTGFGGASSSMSLIFPDDMPIYWVGDDISSILNTDIWELSIVCTESITDSCFKCVLTKFT